jgi:uncharacterized protein
MSDVKSLVKYYLKEARLMQLATVSNNKPWICSVWFAVEDDFTIYFLSKRGRRHSLELSKNNNVAGAIVIPQKPGEKVRGLQFEGTAERAMGDVLTAARECYVERYPSAAKMPADVLREATPTSSTFYVIKPRMFVLFDEVNFPDSPRQEMVV